VHIAGMEAIVRVSRKMTPQAVSAYGEKMVEAALLRLGWIPSNVNDSVKNAARFDIIAQGPDGLLVPIRVKTCGPQVEAFQYAYKRDRPIPTDDLLSGDFTVLVAMGECMTDDRFFIIPTQKVRDELEAGRIAYRDGTRKDGQPLAQNVQFSLHLRPPSRSGMDQPPQRDLARKWERYLDGWKLLGNSN
jgi:hypothetical protein